MSSEPAPAPTRPGPRPRYTREQVFETALTLIDRDEPDAFTMRRLADELGMGVMTLYGYVRNKDEMVEGVTALAFTRLHRETPAGATWEDLVRTEIEQLYQVSRRHPHLVTLILAQRSATPGMFRLRERILGTLVDAGFDLTRALHILGILISYALGFAGLRAGPAPIDLPERIGELPAGAFPHLHEAAGQYSAHVSDEAFDYGLGLLLRGVGADLQNRVSAPRPPRSARR
jgi:AcrR family transcriptional regulator